MKSAKRRKKQDCSPVTPKKSLTPKIVFKKISSQNKKTKKKEIPSIQLIERFKKRSNAPKDTVLPSQNNTLEDEIPDKVTKEKKNKKKEKTDSKDSNIKLTAKGIFFYLHVYTLFFLCFKNKFFDFACVL